MKVKIENAWNYRICRPVVQEEYRNAGFSPEKSQIGTKTPSVPTESHETAMKTQVDDLRKFSNPNNTQVRKRELSRSTQDALLRLAANPQDACALVTVYDSCGTRVKASAIRWFGRDNEVRKRAVNSILAAIGRQAGTYDPQSMDAAEWGRRCADAEARRLREALDTAGSKSLRTRRAM